MTRIFLILGLFLFGSTSCNKENEQGQPTLLGVWKETVTDSCVRDNTHEFTGTGNYLFNPGATTCGESGTSQPYTFSNDTILVNTTTLLIVEKLTVSEFIYRQRFSYGTGYIWNTRRLIR